MPTSTSLAAFALIALAMVLTPGPNMIYLLSRSILQGRAAGFICKTDTSKGQSSHAAPAVPTSRCLFP